MDYEVRISATALEEFREIIEYSWGQFPSNTEKFGNAILNHLDLLKNFPLIGTPVAKRDNVRQLIHTPIAIYYRVNENEKLVEILHFRHNSRKPFY